MSDNLPRRRFLAAGAVLAAGGLLLPSSTAHALTTPASDAELWAILNRPLVGARYADMLHGEFCPKCEEARRAPFTCAACGFQGEPVVYPCTCPKDWEQGTEDYRETLRRTADDSPEGERAAYMLRYMESEGPPSRCAHDESVCAHGGLSCPCCGDTGSGDPFESDEAKQGVAAMLRELHAALDTRRGR